MALTQASARASGTRPFSSHADMLASRSRPGYSCSCFIRFDSAPGWSFVNSSNWPRGARHAELHSSTTHSCLWHQMLGLTQDCSREAPPHVPARSARLSRKRILESIDRTPKPERAKNPEKQTCLHVRLSRPSCFFMPAQTMSPGRAPAPIARRGRQPANAVPRRPDSVAHCVSLPRVARVRLTAAQRCD